MLKDGDFELKINTDHLKLTKFRNGKDGRYKAVREQIQRIKKEAPSTLKQRSQQFHSLKGKYKW